MLGVESVQFWAPQSQRWWHVGAFPGAGTAMETGLRTITSELGLFGPEKKRLRESKQDPECAGKRTLGGLRAGGQAFTSNSCVTLGPFPGLSEPQLLSVSHLISS